MIKIMLVDDEPLEREGLQLMLSKNRSGFEVVAEAENGLEAIDFALELVPDLIFMDIKMPQLDGLQAIEKILDVHPNTKCIMVSAFDMFDYARQAMKFGIKEYLLKPSKVSEVLEAFDRTVADIEAGRKYGNEMLEMNQRLERLSSFIEMEFIVSLLLDHIHEFDQEDWKEWFNLDQKQGFVVVFSFESDQLQPDRHAKSEWYKVLKQTLHEESHPVFVGPLTAFQVPAFVLLDTKAEVNLEDRQNFVRTVIHKSQNQLKDCTVFAGIGTVVFDVNEFSRSYEEAIYALELVYNHSSASYMAYNSQMDEKRTELIPFEVEKELIHSVKKGDIQKGSQLFDSYFQLILQASDSRLDWVKKAMENFFIVLTRSIKEFGFDIDVQMSFDHLETSMQIKERAKTHLMVIMERLSEWRASGVESLLLQAKEYINTNYHKQIMLEEVAENIGLSSYYLSKLFKEKFQVTFIDYLTNTRLQRAKNSLLDGKTPLKEIAMDIGYKDPNYFSRVFKKETGLSPREYRNKYQR
ncbi:two-component system response regulator YesN [Metabacillus crassostreae]|uniref:response regulator n=1 Tax=Metabacillus crassostreae TaxID=929098 RepID=UPI00195D17F7|nr:response regulator [Metabacillus crassostreae]MBM7604384.1 two-component system response regulator YesN [Metabacillus crassostreae]